MLKRLITYLTSRIYGVVVDKNQINARYGSSAEKKLITYDVRMLRCDFWVMIDIFGMESRWRPRRPRVQKITLKMPIWEIVPFFEIYKSFSNSILILYSWGDFSIDFSQSFHTKEEKNLSAEIYWINIMLQSNHIIRILKFLKLL